MNTNQKNTQTEANNQARKNMLNGVTSQLNGAVDFMRSGSTNIVNKVSGLSTGKKVLALAALAIGAKMVQNRMKR